MKCLVQYSIAPLLHYSGSHFDGAFEHELGRTSERDVSKLASDSVETDLQFVAAANQNADRTGEIFHRG